MAQAKKDENHVSTALGWDETTTQPLRCDPSTSRLLIDVAIVSSTVPATNPGRALRDENYITTCGGVTDDASATWTALIVDSRNGRLFVDFA